MVLKKNETLLIAITGPESCGKSTLAKQLSRHFNAPLVDEYARAYLEKTNGEYVYDDLEKIAQGQVQRIEKELLKKPKILFTDTEMTVIKIWSEFKYHNLSPTIEKHYKNQNIDLYLLCKPDLPWEDDPLRENKNEREEIFAIYKKEMEFMQRNFQIISSQGKARFAMAVNHVKKMMELKE